jgi:ketosteroid isomerase-like protein
MGEAREITDRLLDAYIAGDRDALVRLYATDAVAETPDAPRIEGGTAIADYLMAIRRAFPDAGRESTTRHESGDTAIDEGFFIGTHTEALITGEGLEVPPTGRSVRLRECNIVTVRDGMAVSHRQYFDQLDLMSQLGLVEPGGDTGSSRDAPSTDTSR